MEFDELSGKVIGCAIEVHKNLGPGLLESAYERCLSHELTTQDLRHEAQKELLFASVPVVTSARILYFFSGEKVFQVTIESSCTAQEPQKIQNRN